MSGCESVYERVGGAALLRLSGSRDSINTAESCRRAFLKNAGVSVYPRRERQREPRLVRKR